MDEEKEGQQPPREAPRPVPKKPVKKGPLYEDLEGDPLLEALQAKFPGAALSGQVFLEQRLYTVALDLLYEIMVYLRDNPERRFDYLIDITALDYQGEEKRFCLVYHLYSYQAGDLIRVKTRVAEGEMAPSVTSIWKGANWLEREVYDMFGIEFSGHPDLRRLLLPPDWHGHPLRKDYDIKLQDQVWIRGHLRVRKVR